MHYCIIGKTNLKNQNFSFTIVKQYNYEKHEYKSIGNISK